MFRLFGARLGGRMRRRPTANAIIDAAVSAVFAELTSHAKKMKRSRSGATAPSAPKMRKLKKASAPPLAPPRPKPSTAPEAAPLVISKSAVPAGRVQKNHVDVVLSDVNCTLLKHVLSSSSSSSTFIDIPDVARVLRLDYTMVARQHQLAHLADILLVNRIHAALIADAQLRAAAATENDANEDSSARMPMVVLVETKLPAVDAEVQEFILRNALRMHPLPTKVTNETGKSADIPPLTLLVLSEEQTARVRTLTELPPPPPPMPVSFVAPPTAAVTPVDAAVPDVGESAKPTDTSAVTETATTNTTIITESAASALKTKKVRRSGRRHKSKVSGSSLKAPKGSLEEAVAAAAPPRAATAESAGPSSASTGALGIAATSKATEVVTAQPENLSPSPSASPAKQEEIPPLGIVGRSHATGFPVTAATPRAGPRGRLDKLKGSRQKVEQIARRVARVSVKALVGQRRSPATPAQKRLAAAIAAASAAAASGNPSASPPPPRLLSGDDAKEKVMWVSHPDHPLPLRVLAPLVSAAVYAEMQAAATAAPADVTAAAAPSSPVLHTVVYRASLESSPTTVWLGAMQAAAELASALSGGASHLPAAVATLAGVTLPSTTKQKAEVGVTNVGLSENKSSHNRGEKVHGTGRGKTASSAILESMSPHRVTVTPYVYLLIHTSLSPQDAVVLREELLYQYTQLQSTPAGKELAGFSVLTALDVSATQLSYVLEHSVMGAGRCREGMGGMHRPGAIVQVPSATPAVSAEGAEVDSIFQEVYGLLAEQPWLLRSSAPAQGKDMMLSQSHPDALVADAIRVAALTQVLVQRKEVQLREQMAAVQQSQAINADSEAVARAAQRIEMKTMVTEAVEEVSVRHEQATAHLVKTLSSMVGQCSLEKLSETLATIIREEVNPIMDVLEERLKSTAPETTSVTAHSSGVEGADVAEVGRSAIMCASEKSEAHVEDEFAAAASSAALLSGQDAIQESLTGVQAQLRQLSERMSTMAAAAAARQAADRPLPGTATALELSSTSTHDAELQHNSKQEETVELLKDLRERQLRQAAELEEALGNLKNDLQTLAITERPVLTGAAVSHEDIQTIANNAVRSITQTLCENIRSNVLQQLDTYCDVHRNVTASNARDEPHREPSMPVLPVTSFELEEMLTRVVEHVVQQSVGVMESHAKAAVKNTIQDQLSSPSAATPLKAGCSPIGNALASPSVDDGLKAALETLWVQVKAEAAEKEAVKLSHHNRQLLRLFRRQQHLQRGSQAPGAARQPSAPGDALSYMAMEEAMRSVMRPYMAQVQVALAAAKSFPTAHVPSSPTPTQDGVLPRTPGTS